jgi:phage tail sheath gpL-like
MSGAIGFSYIPPNLRVPLFYAEFDNTEAGSSQPVQRALIIGQATTAVPSTPSPAFVPSVAAAQSSYGAGSQLANMIATYRASDPVGELWALPLADATSATAASGTIAFAGTATANGTLFLYIGAGASASGLVNSPVQVGVTSGQVATALATAVAAAINAQYGLPVTAAAASSTVTLTANNKGTLGNDIPITLNYLGARAGQSTPAGLTVTITAMTGGATDPVLTNLATWLGTAAFDFIVNPYPNATALGVTSALMADATGRWSYAAQVYGHVFSASRNTVANLQTLGTGFNDQHLTILGVNNLSPTPAWVWAAGFVGAIAPSIKAQPNRPVQTLTIAGVLPEPIGFDIGFANEQVLLTAGIALASRGPGGIAQIVRAVTTYQLNKFGQPDTSYLDTETMFTLMAVIRNLKGAITQQLPRALLASNGTRLAATPAGATPVIVTPQIIQGILIAAYTQMAANNWVQRADLFAAGLLVQINANDPTRCDVLFDPYLVSGLRIFAVLTQFHLQAAQPAQA